MVLTGIFFSQHGNYHNLHAAWPVPQEKRDPVTVSRPPVPAYATLLCSSSCWGITAATKTITTPTTTVVVTVTPTCHRGLQYASYSASKGDDIGQIPENVGDHGPGSDYPEFFYIPTEIKSWTPTQ